MIVVIITIPIIIIIYLNKIIFAKDCSKKKNFEELNLVDLLDELKLNDNSNISENLFIKKIENTKYTD